MLRRLLIIAVLLLTTVLGLVALGCGDDNKNDEARPTATTSAVEATATPPSDETPSETPFAGGRDPVEKPASGTPPFPTLVDVRAAAHEGFDRIVFEFEGGVPGYRVEYIEPPATGCGSGLPAEIEGAALLQVRVSPANAHDEAGEPTFDQQELMPGLSSILEAEQTCDFEAVVVWAVGLAEEADFSVTDLTDPSRIVVDVAHPPPTQP